MLCKYPNNQLNLLTDKEFLTYIKLMNYRLSLVMYITFNIFDTFGEIFIGRCKNTFIDIQIMMSHICIKFSKT